MSFPCLFALVSLCSLSFAIPLRRNTSTNPTFSLLLDRFDAIVFSLSYTFLSHTASLQHTLDSGWALSWYKNRYIGQKLSINDVSQCSKKGSHSHICADVCVVCAPRHSWTQVCYSEAERKEEAKKRLEKRLEKRENT